MKHFIHLPHVYNDVVVFFVGCSLAERACTGPIYLMYPGSDREKWEARAVQCSSPLADQGDTPPAPYIVNIILGKGSVDLAWPSTESVQG